MCRYASAPMALVVLCAFLWAPASFSQAIETTSEAENALTNEVPVVEEAENATALDEPETEPETFVVDAAEAEMISRVNAEIDRRSDGGDAAVEGSFSDATRGAIQSALRAIFALCIVLALILLSYYGVRRWGKRVPLLAGSSLGSVLGRLHLERGTTLHFIRTAGRVLVVGVNGNSVSLVADFDAAQFASMDTQNAPAPEKGKPFNTDSFLAQLQASSQAIRPSAQAGDEAVDEDEIAVLRGDIQRLQRYLREESREPQD